MRGKSCPAGVVGGLAPAGDDFNAVGIDALTGAAVVDGGDVPYAETLVATGKTIWAATGSTCETIDAAIPAKRVLDAALA